MAEAWKHPADEGVCVCGHSFNEHYLDLVYDEYGGTSCRGEARRPAPDACECHHYAPAKYYTSWPKKARSYTEEKE